MFSMNGIDQRKADLVLRASSLTESTTLSGRTEVNPATLIGNSANIVFIGQSTNNNGITSGGAFTLINTNRVYNGSIGHTGRVFRADDTNGILSSDLTTGHHAMDLGDALVSSGHVQNVVLWNISCGGSYLAQWCPGGANRGTSTFTAGDLAYRIGLAARCIYAAGLDGNITVIDHQHGEADTDVATTQANCTTAITGVINEFKNWGLLRTGNMMFVHLCTRIAGLTASRNAVRAAQAAVVDNVLIKAGVDIDSISSNRPDGTHFNRTGAAAQAALKLPLYTAFL